jgi:hypothetical protein
VGQSEDGCDLLKQFPSSSGRKQGRKEGRKQEGTASRILMAVIKFSR